MGSQVSSPRDSQSRSSEPYGLLPLKPPPNPRRHRSLNRALRSHPLNSGSHRPLYTQTRRIQLLRDPNSFSLLVLGHLSLDLHLAIELRFRDALFAR